MKVSLLTRKPKTCEHNNPRAPLAFKHAKPYSLDRRPLQPHGGGGCVM